MKYHVCNTITSAILSSLRDCITLTWFGPKCPPPLRWSRHCQQEPMLHLTPTKFADEIIEWKATCLTNIYLPFYTLKHNFYKHKEDLWCTYSGPGKTRPDGVRVGSKGPGKTQDRATQGRVTIVRVPQPLGLRHTQRVTNPMDHRARLNLTYPKDSHPMVKSPPLPGPFL